MSKWMDAYARCKYEAIQKRLVLAVTYFRLLNRLTLNELSEKTGINMYSIESGKRPLTIPALIKLESVFGKKAMDNILNHSWHGEGEWGETELKKRIRIEQNKWNKEREFKNKK